MDHCEPGCTCCSTDSNAPLLITINPEARVTAVRTGVRMPRAKAGAWTTVPFSIVNEGFVVGPVVVHGQPVDGVELDAPPLELTGQPRQEGVVRIRVSSAGLVELTLRFWAIGALGGLADKNTVSVLLRAEDEAGGDALVVNPGTHEHYLDNEMMRHSSATRAARLAV